MSHCFSISLHLLVIVLFAHKCFVADAALPHHYRDISKIRFDQKNVVRIQGTGLALFIQAIRSRKPFKKLAYHRNRLVLLYLACLLLSLCFAPEPNPGPRSIHLSPAQTTPGHSNHTTEESSIAPCGTCDRTVGQDDRGVACETCGLWYHATCQNIGPSTYSDLNSSDVAWHCLICDSPNYNNTAYDLFGVEDEHHTSNFSNTSLPSPDGFRPLHCSTPTRATQQNKQRSRPLRVVNVNFCSVIAKKAEFANLLDSVKPDVVVGTETWLRPDIQDSEFIPPHYKVHRKDRTLKGGGGVLIATRDDLQSTRVPELDADCEVLWVKILTPGQKELYICSYYRPDVGDKESLNQFEASLMKARAITNAQLIVAGDLNFPGLDWTSDPDAVFIKPRSLYPGLHQSFLDIINDAGLEQVVHEPTREGNTLDLVLTNRPDLIPRVELVPRLSDHEVVYFEFSTKVARKTNAPREIPLYNKANWDSLRQDMRDLQKNFDAPDNSASVEEMWQLFKCSLQDSMHQHIPHKSARYKASCPWITPELRRLLRRRDRKYRRMKKQGTEQIRAEVKVLQREVQKKLRQAHWLYVANLFSQKNNEEDSMPSTKRFWTYVKQQRTSNIGVAPLKVQGKLVTDAHAKAEALNAQFDKAFSEGKEYDADEFQSKCNMPDNAEIYVTMDNIVITTKGVEKILRGLNPAKATGPDGIPPRVLLETSSEVAPILAKIYQHSIDTGDVPADWREARVAPVFKKGEQYEPANYRPISLTSVPCKVLEHIIVSQLMSHLERYHILGDEQHGFRKHRSCETQLLEFFNELTTSMESTGQTDVVVMDFAKAFDKVNHSLLVHKLHHYGIGNSTNNWIASFLRDRRQSVVVDGERSGFTPVRSGVPQGSVLGPCLFLIYINDLPSRVSSPARLFADDTIVYRLIAAPADHNTLQADLEELERWEDEWDMKFHPNKCSVLSFNMSKNTSSYKYKLHNQEIERVDSCNYLGVTLQTNAKFNTHIDKIVAKANKTLGFLRRNLRKAPLTTRALAYKALVRPTLEYACTVWDPAAKKEIDKLEAVQRRAARFVLNRYQKTASVTKMLQELGWNTLERRRQDARLTMLHKIKLGIAQVKCPCLRPQSHRSRRTHNQTFDRIQCRADYRLNTFFPRTIREWNALPQEVIDAPSLDTFIRRVSSRPL